MQSSEPSLIGGGSIGAFFAFILTLIVLLILGNLAYMLLRRALDGRVSPRAAKWTAAILQYAVIIGGGYASARYLLAFDLNAVVASLGIISIVVAVSSTQITQNILAGILITINRPVQLEEWIVVGELPSTGLCRVRDFSFTTTILQGLDGSLILMPNSSIIASKVVNYSRGGLMEIRVSITIPAWADLTRAREIALSVARDDPRIIQHPNAVEHSIIQDLLNHPYNWRVSSDSTDVADLAPAIHITSVTDGWIKLVIRVWTRKIPQKDDIISRYMREVLRRLSAEEIPVKVDAA